MNNVNKEKFKKLMDCIDAIANDIIEKGAEEPDMSETITISKERLLDVLSDETIKVLSSFDEGPIGIMFALVLPVFCYSVVSNIFDKKEDK